MPSLIGGGFLPHIRSAPLPSPISFHAGSSSHRLKKLEKWNRRGGDCNTCSSSFHHISKWMDGLMPHGDSASEQFGCKSCLYSPDCEETCAEHEKYTSRSTENIFKATPSEDLDIFFNENADLEVQELEAAFSGILHLHDTGEPFFTNPTSNKDNICKQEMNPLYLDANMLKNTSKCGTIPCSEVIQSYHLNLDVKELSNTVVHIDNVLKADNPTHSYLPTSPITRKLVSAMKGSRAQQGMPQKSKLSVKWAPDVYDPPVTSDSHTVKGFRQHSKAKKDYHKHRHSKGKSSRGSGGDRKHAYRRSTGNLIDPRIMRLRAHNDGLLSNGFSPPKLEVEDYAARRHESKFGISCYMEPLPPVHLSVARAS